MENINNNLIDGLKEALASTSAEPINNDGMAQVVAYVQVTRWVDNKPKSYRQEYNPDNTAHKISEVHKLKITSTRVDESTGEYIPVEYYVDTDLLANHMPANFSIRQLIFDGEVKWTKLCGQLNKAGLRMIPTESKNGRLYNKIVNPDKVNTNYVSINVGTSTKPMWKNVSVAHVLDRLQTKVNDKNNLQKVS